jgi:hypothetical protein
MTTQTLLEVFLGFFTAAVALWAYGLSAGRGGSRRTRA